MTDLALNPDDGQGRVVLGETGTSSFTMQQFQDFYALATGKNEEVSKVVTKGYIAELADFEQLDLVIRQMLEQYHVAGGTATYNIYYSGGQKHVHSSYEKFAQNSAASNMVTESVYFKYRFAILLPQIKKPQSYTISVRYNSRLAVRKKLEGELTSNMPRALLNMLAAKTIEVRVEYIDFAVAKAFMATLDAWVDSLHECGGSSALRFLRDKSHFIPPFFRYVGLGCVTWGLISSYPTLLANFNSFAGYSKYVLLSSIGVFLVWRAMGYLGRMVEDAIDGTYDLAYASITRGDLKEIEQAKSESKKELVKAAVGGACSGVAGFLAKFAASLLFIFH